MIQGCLKLRLSQLLLNIVSEETNLNPPQKKFTMPENAIGQTIDWSQVKEHGMTCDPETAWSNRHAYDGQGLGETRVSGIDQRKGCSSDSLTKGAWAVCISSCLWCSYCTGDLAGSSKGEGWWSRLGGHSGRTEPTSFLSLKPSQREQLP